MALRVLLLMLGLTGAIVASMVYTPGEFVESGSGPRTVPVTEIARGRPSLRHALHNPDTTEPSSPSVARATGAVVGVEPGDAGTDPSLIEALIRQIKQEVEPDIWGMSDGPKIWAGSGGTVLFVRAPRPVLLRVEDYLDRKERERAQASAVGVEGLTRSDDEHKVATDELKHVLRGMYAQWQRLWRARTVFRQDRAAALHSLDEVLACEPDHALAREFRDKLTVAPPQEFLDLDSVGNEFDDGPLFNDVCRRVYELRPARLSRWVHRWPSQKTRDAAHTARRRAGMPDFVLVGAERERRLDFVAPQMRLSDYMLDEAIERLSLECLIDIQAIDPYLSRPVSKDLNPRGPTLRDLLEAVSASLSVEHRVCGYESLLELAPPPAEHLYLDVRNVSALLADEVEPSEE